MTTAPARSDPIATNGDERGAVVRVAAVGDLHCGRTDQGALKPLLAAIAAQADILLLCGDLVDRGLPDEARILARELAITAGLPTVAVLGNHDFEAGKEAEVTAILTDAGVRVLDGDSCEIKGVGIAGVKGFPRRLRHPHAGGVGRAGHQGVRSRRAGGSAEDGNGAVAACRQPSASCCFITRRSSPR